MHFLSLTQINIVVLVAAVLAGLAFYFLRKRKSSPMDENFWSELSKNIFEQNGDNIPNRIETTLSLVAKKFGVKNSALLFHINDRSHVIASVSLGYNKSKDLEQGKVLPTNTLLCSYLNAKKDVMAIDAAGTSEWRNHVSYKKYGWEVYLGAYRPMDKTSGISVCFYDNHPRDHFFTQAEKDFTKNLTTWLSSIYISHLSEKTTVRDFQTYEQQIS